MVYSKSDRKRNGFKISASVKMSSELKGRYWIMFRDTLMHTGHG